MTRESRKTWIIIFLVLALALRMARDILAGGF
jgi:hypothetical protein